jgi:signal peptidase II
VSRLTRIRLLGLGLALAIFILDQWIKALVIGPWQLNEVGDQIDLLPFFDLTRVNNYGVSLGMLAATSNLMRWILVGVTSAIALVVFVWLLRERKGWDIFAAALILGGAIGNIRDRVLYGYVIDYADFHIGGFRPFFIFNLADAAISIGVAIMLVRALFMREKPPASQSEGHPSESS